MSMEKLFKIQQELISVKSLRNDFGGFNYRSAEQILEALKPILKKLEAVIITTERFYGVNDMVFCESTATLYELDGTVIAFATGTAREQPQKTKMDAQQITGTTSSYAKKYSLQNLGAIDNTKDSDANNTSEEKPLSMTEQMNNCKSSNDLANWFKGLEKSKQDAMRKRVGVYGKELKAKEASDAKNN